MKLPVDVSFQEVLNHAIAYLLARYLELQIAAGIGVAIALIPSRAGNAELPVRLECPAFGPLWPPMLKADFHQR